MKNFAFLLISLIVGNAFGGIIMGTVTGEVTGTDSAYVFVFHDFTSIMDTGIYYTEAPPPTYEWTIDDAELIDSFDYFAMALIPSGLPPASGDPVGQYPANPFQLSGGIITGIDIPLATSGSLHGHITYAGSMDSVKMDIYDNYNMLMGYPPVLEMTCDIDDADYYLDSIPSGPKTVCAWSDLNNNGACDSTGFTVEPFGWAETPLGGMLLVGGGATTSVDITIRASDVPEKIPVPKDIGIRCFPNPFNSAATILILGDGEPITVRIYDISGREVATLFENTAIEGFIATRFYPPADLPSGTYMLKAKSGERAITKEIIYMK